MKLQFKCSMWNYDENFAFEVESESKRNGDTIFCAETLSSQKQKHQSLQLIACYSSANSFWNCQLGSK